MYKVVGLALMIACSAEALAVPSHTFSCQFSDATTCSVPKIIPGVGYGVSCHAGATLTGSMGAEPSSPYLGCVYNGPYKLNKGDLLLLVCDYQNKHTKATGHFKQVGQNEFACEAA